MVNNMNKEEIKEYVQLMVYNYTLMYVYLGDKEAMERDMKEKEKRENKKNISII